MATARGEPHRDYYTHHPCGEDGGYLMALVDTARTALSALPSVSSVRESIGRASERIAVYQSVNHGDGSGSYELFERWAQALEPVLCRPASLGGGRGSGSTLAVLALIASRRGSPLGQLDSRGDRPGLFSVDRLAALAAGQLGRPRRGHCCRWACFGGLLRLSRHAAARMGRIADESSCRAAALPEGRRHALILAAMTSFYICELQDSASPHAQLVAPSVLGAIGGLATPSMAVLSARRSLRRISIGAPRFAGSS